MKMDMHHNIKIVQGIVPSTAATGNSAIIDTQDFSSIEMVISTDDFAYSGVNSLTPVLHESDDAAFTTSNVVAAEDLLGENIVLDDAADAPGVFRQGYIGNKRYLRVTLTEAGTVTSNIALNFILGHPGDAPTVEQDAVN